MVLPLQNLSGDPEQEYFAHGIVEEIIAAISRLPWRFDIVQFELWQRAQRNHRPGDRHDDRRAYLRLPVRRGALEDIFELQDQIAGSVVGAIEPRLRQSEIERTSHKPTQSLDASVHPARNRCHLDGRGSQGRLARSVVRPAHRRCGIAGCQPGNRA